MGTGGVRDLTGGNPGRESQAERMDFESAELMAWLVVERLGAPVSSRP
jgi:hypothetical protein